MRQKERERDSYAERGKTAMNENWFLESEAEGVEEKALTMPKEKRRGGKRRNYV